MLAQCAGAGNDRDAHRYKKRKARLAPDLSMITPVRADPSTERMVPQRG